MNVLDKSRKKCTSWCEECDQVFDNIVDSEIHRNNNSHKVKIIEFWTISRK